MAGTCEEVKSGVNRPDLGWIPKHSAAVSLNGQTNDQGLGFQGHLDKLSDQQSSVGNWTSRGGCMIGAAS